MYENTINNKILKIPVCLFGFGVQETDLFITWSWIMFKHNHQLTYTKWFCGISSSHGYRRGLSPPSDVVSRLKTPFVSYLCVCDYQIICAFICICCFIHIYCLSSSRQYYSIETSVQQRGTSVPNDWSRLLTCFF